MVNNQGISHIIPYDQVQFKDGQDYVLEIPIKSYISSLNVEVNASVEKIDKSVEKLMSRKNINIDLEENHDNLVDLYLDKTA